MRTIIFLDIDGVLNSERWFSAPDHEKPKVLVPGVRRWRPGSGAQPTAVEPKPVSIEPAAVLLLNHLVREGVEWVLSSTWRGNGTGHDLVTKILGQLGWAGTLVDSTPVLDTSTHSPVQRDRLRGSATRGEEIAAWLARAGIDREQIGKDVRLAIIDDDNDLGDLLEHAVEVDERQGLTPANVLQAALLLDEPLVMVDEVVLPRPWRYRCYKKGMGRLTISDQRHIEQLHEFVRPLKNIHRSWAVDDDPECPGLHYELTVGNRRRAIESGALFVPAIDQQHARAWAHVKGLR